MREEIPHQECESEIKEREDGRVRNAQKATHVRGEMRERQ